MQVPLEISFKGVERTEELDNVIDEKVDKLEQVCNFMIGCHIAIEKTRDAYKSGNPYRVRIAVTVPPGHELVAEHKPGKGDKFDPLPVIVKHTFDAMRKQLKELVEKERGRVKNHPEQQVQAVVSHLFPEEEYGFIRSVDNREIYFHKNSVLHGDYDKLRVGTGVRFVSEQGEKGLQATTVQIIDQPSM